MLDMNDKWVVTYCEYDYDDKRVMFGNICSFIFETEDDAWSHLEKDVNEFNFTKEYDVTFDRLHNRATAEKDNYGCQWELQRMTYKLSNKQT